MNQPLPKKMWVRARVLSALEALDRAPMRRFDVDIVAYDWLCDTDWIETYSTDVGARWVRITDAGRAALGDAKSPTGEAK